MSDVLETVSGVDAALRVDDPRAVKYREQEALRPEELPISPSERAILMNGLFRSFESSVSELIEKDRSRTVFVRGLRKIERTALHGD